MTEPRPDRRVIQCNITEHTNIAAAGARAYVVDVNYGNGNDRVTVLVRSRSGRWVRKWESLSRLDDFRVKTLPPEHPLYERNDLIDWDSVDQVCADLRRARQQWGDQS